MRIKIMKKLVSAVVGVIAVSVLFTASAQAATVTFNTNEPLADTFVPAATSTTGNVFQGVTGSIGGLRRSPWDTISTNDLDENGTYTSVSGDSSAIYELTSAINSFEFMWGSVDDYNIIEFYFNGDWVDMLMGDDAQLAGAPDGVKWINALVSTEKGNLFDEVRFISGGNAFEYANVQLSVVPLPAALPLYGAGIAVLGFMGWRKRRKAATA
jgi:hypothetical protein